MSNGRGGPHIMLGGQHIATSSVAEAGMQKKKELPPDTGVIDPESKARADRFHQIGMESTPAHMSLGDYKARFSEHGFISETVKRHCEEMTRTLFCHACQRTDSMGRIYAFPFHAAIERDQLNVFDALAHVLCHRCGFEEYYPTKKPAAWVEEDNKRNAEILMQHSLAAMKRFKPPPNMTMDALQQLNDLYNEQANKALNVGMGRSLMDAAGMLNNPIIKTAPPPKEQSEFENRYAQLAKKFFKK